MSIAPFEWHGSCCSIKVNAHLPSNSTDFLSKQWMSPSDGSCSRSTTCVSTTELSQLILRKVVFLVVAQSQSATLFVPSKLFIAHQPAQIHKFYRFVPTFVWIASMHLCTICTRCTWQSLISIFSIAFATLNVILAWIFWHISPIQNDKLSLSLCAPNAWSVPMSKSEKSFCWCYFWRLKTQTKRERNRNSSFAQSHQMNQVKQFRSLQIAQKHRLEATKHILRTSYTINNKTKARKRNTFSFYYVEIFPIKSFPSLSASLRGGGMDCLLDAEFCWRQNDIGATQFQIIPIQRVFLLRRSPIVFARSAMFPFGCPINATNDNEPFQSISLKMLATNEPKDRPIDQSRSRKS